MKMSFLKIFSFTFFILNAFRLIPAITFHVQNNCTHTVWAAAVPGGGQELRQGETWMVNVNSNSLHSGRIWPRTNCKFNQNGTGKCETGDCDGVLDCTMSSSSARSPVTIAEYTLDGTHMDYFDISLINGFNIPLEFRAVPGSTGCAAGIKCATDINGLCPTELRHPGGCKHPCNVFRNQQFCCRDQENCDPTASYFKFFKDLCPNAFTYTFDEVNNTFTCLTGTNYTIVFCPLS